MGKASEPNLTVELIFLIQKGKKMKIGNLETVFSSAPVEYNNLTFEILLNGEPIVRVDREEGLDQLKAELFGTDSKLQVRVSLDDLMDALNHAKTGLLSRG